MSKNKGTMIDMTKQDDGHKFIPAALKWLYEMEALNSKQLINNLYINIYSQSKQIKDVQLLIDRNSKKMLIYIRFGMWANLFKSIKKNVASSVLDNLQELLPSFEFRIVEDRETFDKALKLAKKMAIGGKDGTTKDSNDESQPESTSDEQPSNSEDKSELQETSNILSDQEESSEPK